jgi:prepilin-type N-terminal cleavage/methylation domain-containing protein
MRSRRGTWRKTPDGFTLVEMIVVLVLLALAAALAAPTLGRNAGPRESGLPALLTGSREAAARRGETVYLRIAASGAWRMEGGGAAEADPIQGGELEPFDGLPLAVIVSPVGSCGFDAASAKAAAVIPLDPLSCTLLPSR